MPGRTLDGSESDLKVEAIYHSTVGDESALHLCRAAHLLARVRLNMPSGLYANGRPIGTVLQNNHRAQVRELLFGLHIGVRLALSGVGGESV